MLAIYSMRGKRFGKERYGSDTFERVAATAVFFGAFWGRDTSNMKCLHELKDLKVGAC